MITPLINKYGIDYRDVHNFTPLHAAVFSGAVNITQTLLDNGANPVLIDTFSKTPIQIALEQAFVLPDYGRNVNIYWHCLQNTRLIVKIRTTKKYSKELTGGVTC